MSDHPWRVTLRDPRTGDIATVVSYASDPDDACCLDHVDDWPEDWPEDADVEILGVEWG